MGIGFLKEKTNSIFRVEIYLVKAMQEYGLHIFNLRNGCR
jgi:hypothetical protein